VNFRALRPLFASGNGLAYVCPLIFNMMVLQVRWKSKPADMKQPLNGFTVS
jgi:hypothetical protein